MHRLAAVLLHLRHALCSQQALGILLDLGTSRS